MRRRTGSQLAVVVLIVSVLSIASAAEAQQADKLRSPDPWPPVATFSILGYDPETGEVGGAVQSRVFSVGNGVLWAEAGVGVVATQAIVDVSYGPQALVLLRQGLSAAKVVAQVLADDPNPRPEDWTKEGRQFSVMTADGDVATHTGSQSSDWAGHEIARAQLPTGCRTRARFQRSRTPPVPETVRGAPAPGNRPPARSRPRGGRGDAPCGRERGRRELRASARATSGRRLARHARRGRSL